MTIEYWEEMTPCIFKILRSINAIVAANPQWFMLEKFDVFGARLLSIPVMKKRFNDNILSLKE